MRVTLSLAQARFPFLPFFLFRPRSGPIKAFNTRSTREASRDNPAHQRYSIYTPLWATENLPALHYFRFSSPPRFVQWK